MAKINISSLDIESLLALRKQVDAKLGEHRQSLHKQLTRLGFDEAPRKGMGSRPSGAER